LFISCVVKIFFVHSFLLPVILTQTGRGCALSFVDQDSRLWQSSNNYISFGMAERSRWGLRYGYNTPVPSNIAQTFLFAI
jgi:hypothetical protein